MAGNVPTNITNPVVRIAIAGDYVYRRKFWSTTGTTDVLSSNIDYSDMMELPNFKYRDVLLTNLNNGSTISTIIKPR